MSDRIGRRTTPTGSPSSPARGFPTGRRRPVAGDDLRVLIGWLDANCPYRGDDVRALPDPSFAGIEFLPIPPRIRTAPRIARP